MRYRTRRLVALTILVTICLSIETVTKFNIVFPLAVALLIDFDNWNFEEEMKKRAESLPTKQPTKN